MNSPITISCIKTVLQKQIVLRAKRLIRVRKFKCLFSIFCVFCLPISWFDASCRTFICSPIISVAADSHLELTVLLIEEKLHLYDSQRQKPKLFHFHARVACHSHLWFVLFPTKLHISSNSASSSNATFPDSARQISTVIDSQLSSFNAETFTCCSCGFFFLIPW